MIHYGDNLRWFVADVIDASPPYGYEGRVRVRIHGVHNPSTRQVKQNDLPWAQVVLPTTEGGVSGLGSTPRLEGGALVFGMFMDGKESQVPIVLGSLPRTEFPTAVQQSLAFQDLLERVDPDIDFYNQSLAAIDIDDAVIADTETKADDSTVRHSTALKFFLSNNYSLKQASAITGSIRAINYDFSTEEFGDGVGLLKWNDVRLNRLKAFSSKWQRFSTQLSFILYELNTTHVDANVRVLNCDVINPSKSAKNLGYFLGRFYTPTKGDWGSEAFALYTEYKNSDGRS